MARSSGSAMVNLESALESANSALVVLQNDLGRDVHQNDAVMAGFVHFLQALASATPSLSGKYGGTNAATPQRHASRASAGRTKRCSPRCPTRSVVST